MKEIAAAIRRFAEHNLRKSLGIQITNYELRITDYELRITDNELLLFGKKHEILRYRSE